MLSFTPNASLHNRSIDRSAGTMDRQTCSFDVFDTVLTRVFLHPTDLFLEVARRLRALQLLDGTDEDWADARVQAETACRNVSSREEVTLEEIYVQLASSLNWTPETVGQAMGVEIQTEIDCIRPIESTRQKIDETRKAGGRVVFVSDMYLPSDVLRSMLTRHGAMRDGDDLFVSSELGVSKATGGLYQHLIETDAIAVPSFQHLGDNPISDVVVPQSMGLRATHLSLSGANRYENALYSAYSLPRRARSCLAGVSRALRLGNVAPSGQLQTIWDVGCNVVAPTLLGFVLWALDTARQRNIERLYFVARDGQILARVADVLQREWGGSIDVRYLYGSRWAWLFPALTDPSSSSCNWIFLETPFVSVRLVCHRVNLEPEDIHDELMQFGFSPQHWDSLLASSDLARLRECFSLPSVKGLIQRLAANCCDKTIGYLEQEELLDGTPFAIVDIGWRGNLQTALETMLQRARGVSPNVVGFYYALWDYGSPTGAENRLCYFSAPDDRGLRRDLGYPYNPLYEIFTAADHGVTSGYDQDARGRYVPVLERERNDGALSWGLEIQQKAVLTYAAEVACNCSRNELSPHGLLDASERVLSLFLREPTRLEADAYGCFPFSTHQTEEFYDELAPPISGRQYLAWKIMGQSLPFFPWWSEGTIARSDITFERQVVDHIERSVDGLVENLTSCVADMYRTAVGGALKNVARDFFAQASPVVSRGVLVDPLDFLRPVLNQVSVLFGCGLSEAAIETLGEALNAAADANNPSVMVSAVLEAARILQSVGMLVEAGYYGQRALEIAVSQRHPGLVKEVKGFLESIDQQLKPLERFGLLYRPRLNECEVLLQSGKTKESADLLSTMVRAASGAEVPAVALEIVLESSRIMARCGKHNEARAFAGNGVVMARALNQPFWIQQAYGNLKEIMEGTRSAHAENGACSALGLSGTCQGDLQASQC
jgi:predicted HAD superfamily hydrolase